MNVVIMIPSLNPDEKLVNYVDALSREDFRHILVINDGSSEEYNGIFDRLKSYEKCTVISHDVNRGKGRALKTGMEYVLTHFPDCVGIVTGDADGQHRLIDTIHVANALEEKDDRLVLGARNFNSGNIPARSSFGNKLTSQVFALMFGQKLMDTQTGLRGISLKLIPKMLQVSGERFEYEMNMLIECRKQKIEIFEVPIETVYIDENSSSHFRPVVDSVKIYWLIFKGFFSFAFTSVSCTVLDLLLFQLFIAFILPQTLAHRILIATTIARVISSVANFLVNKNVVFKKRGSLVSSAVKYYILVVIQMLISAYAVTWLFNWLGWGEVILKAMVDTTLFFVNYFIQKNIVFRNKTNK
ncbi:MAG: GtrA family protein [Acutalibacteraceae bacterium]|nr:bifunctional glycosyltransferase family 2/GtrA family protein [Bacillota bacterium]